MGKLDIDEFIELMQMLLPDKEIIVGPNGKENLQEYFQRFNDEAEDGEPDEYVDWNEFEQGFRSLLTVRFTLSLSLSLSLSFIINFSDLFPIYKHICPGSVSEDR